MAKGICSAFLFFKKAFCLFLSGLRTADRKAGCKVCYSINLHQKYKNRKFSEIVSKQKRWTNQQIFLPFANLMPDLRSFCAIWRQILSTVLTVLSWIQKPGKGAKNFSGSRFSSKLLTEMPKEEQIRKTIAFLFIILPLFYFYFFPNLLSFWIWIHSGNKAINRNYIVKSCL